MRKRERKMGSKSELIPLSGEQSWTARDAFECSRRCVYVRDREEEEAEKKDNRR